MFSTDKEMKEIQKERDMVAGYLQNAQIIEELIGDTAGIAFRFRELFKFDSGRYPKKGEIEEVYRSIYAYTNLMREDLSQETISKLRAIADALEHIWWKTW